MANIFTKLPLSSSISGKQIIISSTTSQSAIPIHGTLTDPTSIDEIWLYGYNDSTASLILSCLWGGVKEPDDVVRITIPPKQGRYLLADGKLLQGGLSASCYASTGNWIAIDGFVNRITTI